jgi:excisionase family DNA binding protein
MHENSNGAAGRPPRPLLRPNEAAKFLAVSERTLWTLTDRGDLPAVRIGRLVRYAAEDLEAYVEANRGRAGRRFSLGGASS